MKPIKLIALLSVLSFTGLVQAQVPSPMILKPGEQIVYKGNLWDSVSCEGRNYSRHDFSIVVTEVDEDCNCDTTKTTRIYEDGLLRGTCDEDYSVSAADRAEYSFLDLKFIEKISDKDLEKLLQYNNNIGSCSFSGQSIYAPNKAKEAFESYLVSTAIDLPKADRIPQKIFIKATRDFIKDGLCGDFSSISPEQKIKTRKLLGRLDIGFDLMVAEGADGLDLAQMSYPAKKILAKFNVSAEEFKKAGYNAKDLLDAGFKFEDLKNAKYSLNDMYRAGVALKDLKTNFSTKELFSAGVPADAMKAEGFEAQALASAGYGLRQLVDAGYDVKKNLRSIFTIQDFLAVKGSYGSNVYDVSYLRQTAGFTASELKDAGISIRNLQEGGFDPKLQLKPIFSLKEFLAVKGSYGSQFYTNDFLKNNLGFTAAEMKAEGVTIRQLQEAGFDPKRDLKSLFSLKEFLAVKGSYGSQFYTHDFLKNTLGFTASELKAEGVTIRQLQDAGYDMVKDIKPLYTLKEIRAVRGSYNGQYYTNDFLKNSLGYSAKELRAEGLTIRELSDVGFNMLTEVKPLFNLNDFLAVKGSYGNRFYTVDYLKDSLKYSASELKAGGITVRELADAGFSLSKDLKPIFTAKDFASVKGSYGNRYYGVDVLRNSVGFSALEMKEAGFTLRELFDGGYTKAQLREAGFTVEQTDAL